MAKHPTMGNNSFKQGSRKNGKASGGRKALMTPGESVLSSRENKSSKSKRLGSFTGVGSFSPGQSGNTGYRAPTGGKVKTEGRGA